MEHRREEEIEKKDRGDKESGVFKGEKKNEKQSEKKGHYFEENENEEGRFQREKDFKGVGSGYNTGYTGGFRGGKKTEPKWEEEERIEMRAKDGARNTQTERFGKKEESKEKIREQGEGYWGSKQSGDKPKTPNIEVERTKLGNQNRAQKTNLGQDTRGQDTTDREARMTVQTHQGSRHSEPSMK